MIYDSRRMNKGFTLVEFIIYLGVFVILLTSLATFMHSIVRTRVKNQVVSEVEQQGIQVMQMITQTVRNAEDIIAPAVGASGNSLTVDVVTGANDPTIFALAGNVMQITEGVDPAVNLTNSKVEVSGLTFQNAPRSGHRDSIDIEFTVSHVNPENDVLYNFNKTFYGSADIRY